MRPDICLGLPSRTRLGWTRLKNLRSLTVASIGCIYKIRHDVSSVLLSRLYCGNVLSLTRFVVVVLQNGLGNNYLTTLCANKTNAFDF